MIYILFGEMGVGKNYIGEKIAAHMGCPFFDGDDAFPAHLKKKIDRCQSLTVEEVEGFVRENLIPEINDRSGFPPDNLVVAQALYRADHRAMIDAYFGPEVMWVHVKPPGFFTHMRRLFSRVKGLRWMFLALMSKGAFQKPAYGTLSFNNTNGIGVEHIVYHLLDEGKKVMSSGE